MSLTPVNLVIFGASGDLTHRLLLPGLGTLLKNDPDQFDIQLVGASNEQMTNDQWRDLVSRALQDGGCDTDKRFTKIVQTTYFKTLDATNSTDLAALLDKLTGPVVLYFALPPSVTMKSCQALKSVDLPADIRLAVEKPFGTSLETAREFNDLLRTLVKEEQIFRVDHFLGKAQVLNLMGLRFANRIFEPVWNAQAIDRVEIVADEALALEGRAGYYDRNGALKDMIQSHLLEILAMFAMEEPARIDAVELRDLMVHALRATHVKDDDAVANSRRARYTAGTVDGREIPNYVDEPDVDPSRGTETLAEVTVEIRNSRWAGVPFRLRSGKALGDGYHGITVLFKPVAHLPEGLEGDMPRNVLMIGLGPEHIYLKITTTGEGDAWDMEQTTLAAELGESPLRPYGQILEGILSGDPLLAVRGDMAEECWRILNPVFEAWNSGAVPLDEYHAGSSGPANWR